MPVRTCTIGSIQTFGREHFFTIQFRKKCQFATTKKVDDLFYALKKLICLHTWKRCRYANNFFLYNIHYNKISSLQKRRLYAVPARTVTKSPGLQWSSNRYACRQSRQ